MTLTRPPRAEELRLEQTSREQGGDFAYAGVRHCTACGTSLPPVHPDNTDRQICGTCGTDLPGPAVTWAIRHDDTDGTVFVLRHGDRCVAGAAPVVSSDPDVNRVLAGNVWLTLEHILGLTDITSRT